MHRFGKKTQLAKIVWCKLYSFQVNVVHINATAKNAADDKLRQSIRRFAHNHAAPTTLVLITGKFIAPCIVQDLFLCCWSDVASELVHIISTAFMGNSTATPGFGG